MAIMGHGVKGDCLGGKGQLGGMARYKREGYTYIYI
jgi:hypothetical protein